jgi:radical SAM protein with 4Fe4S-binding SPASM domain
MEISKKRLGDFTVQEAFDICDNHEHCEDCKFYNSCIDECIFHEMSYYLSHATYNKFSMKLIVDSFLDT